MGIILLFVSAFVESIAFTKGAVFTADHFTSVPLNKTALPERSCVFSTYPISLVKLVLVESLGFTTVESQLLDIVSFDFIFLESAEVISDFGAVNSPSIFHLNFSLSIVKS